MRDSRKTKLQLIKELGKLRRRVAKNSITQPNKNLQNPLQTFENNFSTFSQNINDLTISNSLINIGLHAVLEAATFVSIIATDTKGVITVFNAGAERMLGYSAKEVIGKQSLLMMHSDSELDSRGKELSEQFGREISGLNVLVELVRQGEHETREWTYFTKDGQQLVVSLSVTALRNSSGKLLGYLALATDITERKQVHEQLEKAKEEAEKAKEEAEKAVRIKSEFLANMSHEIRTPMNAVIGMTGLLLDTNLSLEQKDYVEIIRSSGDALLTIINDILDFSKIEAGRLELEKAPFDIKDCIEESMVLLASKAAEKGLTLTYSIDPMTPRIVIGDMARLRQIIVNLLSNAVKFTKIGEVSISVKATLIEALDQKFAILPDNENKLYQLHFSVKDTGIGIPEDRVNNLFQPFTQVDTSTTRKYGGTGLGLAISKLLCELMGGIIWIESTPNIGSTFHFVILSQVAPNQLLTHCDIENILVDKQLLIIVDDPVDQYLLAQQTESWEMSPRATTLVDEAIYWIRDGGEFDAIILDAQFYNYQTFLKQLREYSNTQIPLILLTSADKVITQTHEIAGILVKPFNPHHLYEMLTENFSNLATKTQQSKALLQIDYEMASKQPLRLLLAEDNAVNQKVALKMLEKMGYRADVAGNGLEVLDALERQNYDVILMDLQMPEMDGIETTRKIRQLELSNKPRIIAMTASVMQGDRENCLEAGMDDYISKPVRIEQLQAVLRRCYQLPTEKLGKRSTERLGGKTNNLSGSGKLTGETQMLPPIDLAVLESLQEIQVPGEPNLLLELIDMFIGETPVKLDNLRNELQKKDFELVKRIAHNLKGSSGSLGANPMMKICGEIEQRCKNKALEGIEVLLVQLEMEFMRAEYALLREREKLHHL